jgi:hypothetical protein
MVCSLFEGVIGHDNGLDEMDAKAG